jgi:hypothetical protein
MPLSPMTQQVARDVERSITYHLTVIDKDHKKLGGGGNKAGEVLIFGSSSLHFFHTLGLNRPINWHHVGPADLHVSGGPRQRRS